MNIFNKAICFVLGHSWIISKRIKERSYSYYEYRCTCCGEIKEEL